MKKTSSGRATILRWSLIAAVGAAAPFAIAAIIDLTLNDFKLPGTRLGEVGQNVILSSANCMVCHGNFSTENDHVATWEGSLMGQAGRDPLFFAQMSNANQDVANAGYFCMKCHVPNTWVSGNAMPPDGSALNSRDLEGVSCHFCHAMTDPIFRPGISPPEDEAVLAGLLSGPPEHYGNAMFVIDPTGTRRAARVGAQPMHEAIHSPFHTTGNFCGTCHEVGNVAVSRQLDGSYRYNEIDAPTPDPNPTTMFPLERTFSEWRLSAFANGGVNMRGRFGGTREPIVSTCQDCHMPGVAGQNTPFTAEHQDLPKHSFAGASAQALDIIAAFTAEDPNVNQASITRGRAAAVDMLQRAATLEISQASNSLVVRVTNESGHKLPTGHIEGRRVWVNTRLLDTEGTIIREYGHYDEAEAHLDESTTRIYEMLVGLSQEASTITGLPAGVTGHMALANTIEKDTRIPPRGFDNAAFEEAGAPVVGHTYADEQHWDIQNFEIPAGAVRAEVRIFYQQTPRHYIEELRDNNHTNNWGNVLHQLWMQTGRGAPIEMAKRTMDLGSLCIGDADNDGDTDSDDITAFFGAWESESPAGDVDGDGDHDFDDLITFFENWDSGC